MLIEFEGQRIEVPDDVTDDEIRYILSQQPPPDGSGAPARKFMNGPSAHAKPSLSAAAKQTETAAFPVRPQIGTQGAGASLANVIGGPVDLVTGLVNAGLNLFGGPQIEKPYGGSERIKDSVAEGARRGAAGEGPSGFLPNPLESIGGVWGSLTGLAPIDTDDMNSLERLIYNVNDFGGQAALAGGPMAAQAMRKGTQWAQGALPRFWDELVRPYASSPGRTFAGDVAGGVGAGVGVTAAEEFAPDSPVAQAFAALAGSGAASAGVDVGRMGGRFASDLTLGRRADPNVPRDSIDFSAATRRDVETASRMSQQTASNPQVAARDIKDRSAAFREQELPVPTAGLMTDDVGMQAAESAGRTRNAVPFIERDRDLRAAATSRVERMLDPEADQSAPGAAAAAARETELAPKREQREQVMAELRSERTGHLEDVQAEQARTNARLAEDEQRADIRAKSVQRQNEEVAVPMATVANSDARANASAALDRSLVDETYIPDRTRKNELYDQADPDQPVDLSNVQTRAAELRAEIEKLPPSLRDRAMDPALLADLENLGTLNLDAARRTRMELRGAEDAARAGGQFGQVDNLRSVRQPLQEAVDAASPDAAANYRENFAPRYRAGPGDEAEKFTREVDRDPTRSKTPRSETAGRFLGSRETVQSLKRVFAGQPTEAAGNAAVRDYLRSEFASSVLNPDSTLNARRAAAWMRNRADVLAEFPAVRAEFDDLAARARQGEQLSGEAKTALKEARTRRRTTEQRLERDRRSTEQRLDRNIDETDRVLQRDIRATEEEIDRSIVGNLLNEDPRDVADRILSGRWDAEKDVDRINGILKNDEAAQRGWKAAVSEALHKRVTGTTKIDEGRAGSSETFRAELDKLDKLFKDHERLLTKIYSPEEMSNLRQAHAVLEPLKNATVRATGGSNTADKFENVWRVAEAGLKAKYGVLKGGGILRTLRIVAATLPNNNESVQRLIERAWFDPDLAQYLLTNKVRDLDYQASNAWVRRIMAGAEYGRESSEEE